MTVELDPTENDTINTIHQPDIYKSRIFATMKIKGGNTTKFQIDTGATCNVLKRSELKGTKYEQRIKPTAHIVKMYNNSSLTPLGKCKIQVQDPTTKQKFKVPFTVVDDQNAKSNLLGCRTVQQMNLIQIGSPIHVDQINEDLTRPDQMGLTMQNVKDTYQDVFEGLGTLGPALHLEVDPEMSPVQLPPRKIPESLKQPLREHLDELVKLEVIERVDYSTDPQRNSCCTKTQWQN